MNPLFIKQSGGSIRKVKTDKADAKKIAKYGLDNWMDFITTFWHCECIALVSEAVFTERYRKWCKRKGYHFSGTKAAELYIGSIGHITTLPKNSNTKLIITTAAKELASAKSTLAVLRAEMDRLARQLPEYDTVRDQLSICQEEIRRQERV